VQSSCDLLDAPDPSQTPRRVWLVVPDACDPPTVCLHPRPASLRRAIAALPGLAPCAPCSPTSPAHAVWRRAQPSNSFVPRDDIHRAALKPPGAGYISATPMFSRPSVRPRALSGCKLLRGHWLQQTCGGPPSNLFQPSQLRHPTALGSKTCCSPVTLLPRHHELTWPPPQRWHEYPGCLVEEF
jgi:hypothetical protein